jgi:hypothetical protein
MPDRLRQTRERRVERYCSRTRTHRGRLVLPVLPILAALVLHSCVSLGTVVRDSRRLFHLVGPLDSGARSGELNLLTYNVAGLPGFISDSDPAANTPRVSPLLNDYDIVLAQEDFSYHQALIGHAKHPYQVEPRPPRRAFVGDGLSTLSVYPVLGTRSVEWRGCYGYLGSLSDCLSEKGFSFARIRLGDGAHVDVYNIHADAGNSEGDVAARRQGFSQLAEFISTQSAEQAVIVAGDTNLEPDDPRDLEILEQFLVRTALSDSCAKLGCQRGGVDRVMVRGTSHLALTATRWAQDERFVDAHGEALSDHPAVSVRVRWAVVL